MVWYVSVALALVVVVLVALAVKAVVKLTTGMYPIGIDLTGRNVLITGPTGGIGRETALELARHGATVHLLARNTAKANALLADIERATGKSGQVYVWELDVSSLQSVRQFVRRYKETRPADEPVDVLINNAGCGWFARRTLTEEGLETTMATNHFGHFLLTNLLLDRLKLSQQGRIVNVSSLAHWPSPRPKLDDLNFERSYSQWVSYNISKLANVLFTSQLAVLLKDTDVTAYALHPGAVRTDLFRHWDWYLKPVYAIMYPFLKTPFEGAQTTLYCAVAPELAGESGKYYSDCGRAKRSPIARDAQLAANFWQASEDAVGIKPVSQ